jgi:cardiolipin synthase
VHVVLHKRDTRSALGWIGLIWLSPILGSVTYVLLGINRISRKAHSLRRDQVRTEAPADHPCSVDRLESRLGPGVGHLESLARLVGQVTGQALLAGNAVEPLPGGDAAYPAMLRAIDGATRSVALASYIFNDDEVGRQFVAALGKAVRRGVEVRVLLDDIGARYHWPTAFGPLRREGVTAARFMPTLTPGYVAYMNLRNHRKILVADGRVGFTGGMNIDRDFCHEPAPRRPRNDLHFRLRGPVVADLMRTFVDDWSFTTDELLQGEAWFPDLEPTGPVLARGVPAGPDQDVDRVQVTFLGALAAAEESVAIVTPYFLPDTPLLSALYVAAMRGVRVDILLPSQNNLLTVHWASRALLPQVLEGNCHVWYAPPPFDHTKLMIVDRAWTFLGSANWDARSLRLNFEFNVECYDASLAGRLHETFQARLREAAPVTIDELNRRSLPVKIRDGVARLFSPYL